jgi:hypothetical protein
VRVGVHYGVGSVKWDKVAERYDFFGDVVNTAARVEAAAHGGQVCVTRAAFDAAAGESIPNTVCVNLGATALRGCLDPVELLQILPTRFSTRAFPPLRLDIEPARLSEEHTTTVDDGSKVDVTTGRGSLPSTARADVMSLRSTTSVTRDRADALRRHMAQQYRCDVEPLAGWEDSIRTLTQALKPVDREKLVASLCKAWRVQHDPKTQAEQTFANDFGRQNYALVALAGKLGSVSISDTSRRGRSDSIALVSVFSSSVGCGSAYRATDDQGGNEAPLPGTAEDTPGGGAAPAE